MVVGVSSGKKDILNFIYLYFKCQFLLISNLEVNLNNFCVIFNMRDYFQNNVIAIKALS